MAANCEKTVKDLFAAWTRLSVDEIMACFAEDAVLDNVPMAPAKGKAAIREMTQGFLKDANSFTAQIVRSVGDGNVVFNERIDMFDIGEKRIELPVAGVFEVRGGKITLWRDYFDLPSYTKQMS